MENNFSAIDFYRKYFRQNGIKNGNPWWYYLFILSGCYYNLGADTMKKPKRKLPKRGQRAAGNKRRRGKK
tara:strand:- start:1896 stop:2105 length:210 start_codon:yes stop_codon:yes gene_type:complete